MKIAFLTSGGIAPCLSASIASLIQNYEKSKLSFEYIISLVFEPGFIYSTLLLFAVIPVLYIHAALSIKRLKDSDKGWEWGFLVIVISTLSNIGSFESKTALCLPVDSKRAVTGEKHMANNRLLRRPPSVLRG